MTTGKTTGKTTVDEPTRTTVDAAPATPAPAPDAAGSDELVLKVNPALYPTDVVQLQAPDGETMIDFTREGTAVPAKDVEHYIAQKEGAHQYVVKA